jgi:hypothetical protein
MEEYKEKKNERLYIYNEKKKERKEIKEEEKKHRVRFCSTKPRRQTERIIFCCRRYVAGPIFSLSFHPPAILSFISLCVCVCYVSRSVWFFMCHACTYFGFFSSSSLSMLWFISREDQER